MSPEAILSQDLSLYDNPPRDQWAEHVVIDLGEEVDRYHVPFTDAEYSAIQRAEKASKQEGLSKGYRNGGPERRYVQSLLFPRNNTLKDRGYAVRMLQRTLQNAANIIETGWFSPELTSRQELIDVKEALTPFSPQKKS